MLASTISGRLVRQVVATFLNHQTLLVSRFLFMNPSIKFHGPKRRGSEQEATSPKPRDNKPNPSSPTHKAQGLGFRVEVCNPITCKKIEPMPVFSGSEVWLDFCTSPGLSPKIGFQTVQGLGLRSYCIGRRLQAFRLRCLVLEHQ